MPFTLDSVVPWGRSFKEYLRMFALGTDDLRRRMVGCGDGPASFNSVATQAGARVVSVDPIYQFDADALRGRIAATSATVIEQTRQNAGEFVWGAIRSIDHLLEVRMGAMQAFLDDLPSGRLQGRYVAAGLPALPFRDGAFELGLCSHFLFLYSEQLDQAFHLAAIREMCRVATEARIFPLLELGSRPSRHLEGVATQLREEGFSVSIERVPYEFQRGGNEMMRVRGAGPAPGS